MEEVLQLGEPVAQLAPAAVPGMLLAGIGSGLAAYRLVRPAAAWFLRFRKAIDGRVCWCYGKKTAMHLMN